VGGCRACVYGQEAGGGVGQVVFAETQAISTRKQALGPREQFGEMNSNTPPTNAKAHQVPIPAQGVERKVLVLAPAKAAPCILQSAVTWKRPRSSICKWGASVGASLRALRRLASTTPTKNEDILAPTRTRGRRAAAAIANRKWEGEGCECYRWIPHNAVLGFSDIASATPGVFASLDRL
jgi:hypothetical protein